MAKSMKVILNESQLLKIAEARKDGFRLDALREMSFTKRVAYCKQWLGNPIGNGSSRMVFQLDDYSCLKLARNPKGIAQNLEEIRLGTDNYLSCFPKILNGSDTENGLWIVSEYVLPAKPQDFERCHGIKWEKLKDFIDALQDSDCRDYFVRIQGEDRVDAYYQEYEDDDEIIDIFNNIMELLRGYNQGIGDLMRLQNWGMVNRSYGPEMVILDSGLSHEIFYKYYSKKPQQ